MQKNKLSRDMVDLKIWKSDWARVFWPLSQEQDFSQIWDLWKDISKNINFHFKPSSEELMTKFLNKFKKTYFWLIFGTFSPFLKENNIFKKQGSATHNFGAPTTMLEARKN